MKPFSPFGTILAVILLMPLSSSFAQVRCDINFPGPTPACKDYLGDNWNVESARADCGEVLGAPQPGTLVEGAMCSTDEVVGNCRVDQETVDEALLSFYSGDLVTLESFCTGPLNGIWTEPVLGRCDYQQIVVGAPDSAALPTCRAYTGDGWAATSAEDDCTSLDQASFTLASNCPLPSVGQCTFGEGTPNEIIENYSAGDATALAAGCGFAGGTWNEAQAVDDPVMPQAVEALISDELVSVNPDGCDQACSAELAQTGDWIEFTPQNTELRGGIIFYGGEDVDPRAYAVFARSVAEAGYFVAIPTFIGNISILDPFRASSIILEHPEVPAWGIVGHSLGGVSAAVYADVNPLNVIEGIVMLAGFPAIQLGAESDLSDNDLRVYMLRGSNDGLLNLDDFNDGITRTPDNVVVDVLRGGNHAQYGYYGRQAGDIDAEISREQQHALAVGTTLHMASHFGLDSSENFIDPIYQQLQPDNQLCARAQRQIAGFSGTDLRANDIVNTTFDTIQGLQFFQPGFETGDTPGLVSIGGVTAQTPNGSDVTAPSILEGEQWCKMKSQDAFVEEYNFSPLREEAECAVINSRIFWQALLSVDRRDLIAYLRSRTRLSFVPDFSAANGVEWVERGPELEQLGDSNFELSASRLRTPTFIPGVPAEFLGVNYCRVWSTEAAVQFIKERVRR